MIDRIPGDLGGLAVVMAGLAVFTLLLALDERRKRPSGSARVAKPVRAHDPACEWQTLIGIVEDELSHAPAIADLQARALLQLDAAEHAFNAVLRTCTPYFKPAVAPTVEPVRELVREVPAAPAPARQSQPLAA